MGISYSPVLMVGKWFEDEGEATEYYTERVGAFEDEHEEGLGEYLYSQKGDLKGTWLDHYSRYGYLLGYHVALEPYDSLGERIKTLQSRFKAVFDDDPGVHNEVSIS